MKTAVVTGASGFIGGALTSGLLERGYEVFAVVRDEEQKARLSERKGLYPLVCDLADQETICSAIGKEAGCFIHLAWEGVSGVKSRQIETQLSNIKVACMAMELAKRLHTERFLFAGSSYQYRMEAYIQNGREQFARKNLYGISKQAASDLLRAMAIAYGMTFNTVLFTNVFGVGDCSQRSTNVLIGKLLAGEDLELIDGGQAHDWTYIDDAVQGILAVLNKGVDGASYYIGSRSPRTFKEIITDVRDLIAPKARLKFGCFEDEAYIDYSQIDLNALYRDTGFECATDFSESILETAEWVKTLEF